MREEGRFGFWVAGVGQIDKYNSVANIPKPNTKRYHMVFFYGGYICKYFKRAIFRLNGALLTVSLSVRIYGSILRVICLAFVFGMGGKKNGLLRRNGSQALSQIIGAA